MDDKLAEAIGVVSELDPAQVQKALSKPKELKFGDFAFPCFMLAKSWKLSPPECAEKLAKSITLPDGISKAEVVGPYLNFFRNRTLHTGEVLRKIISEGELFGVRPASGDKIVLEYSSPNIAKTFHLGHLRNNLLGASLYRILTAQGYDVVCFNHLGDWGIQFGFVYAGCELWEKPETMTVEALAELYARAAGLRKAQDEDNVPEEDKDKPNVNEMARSYFKRLEDGEPDAIAFWENCVALSMDYFKDLYARMNCHFDHHIGEAYFRDKLGEVESALRDSDLLEESRGALGVDLGKKLGFVRVFTIEGVSLYVTRDLAAADYRIKNFDPVKILHVVATQQELYFRQLIGVLNKMEHPAGERLVHVQYGMVPGMSARKGTGVSLKNFLEEAHTRALTAYREEVEKRPEGVNEEEVAESVALGATYFYFLNHSNLKDFQFSWEEALTFQGDTGPYVQYAHARLGSIADRAKAAGLTVGNTFDSEKLSEEVAYELVSLLASFDDVVAKAAEEYEPMHLTQYVLNIARVFSKAYNQLRVVGEEAELAQARLALFSATKIVLRRALEIIGIPAIEKM